MVLNLEYLTDEELKQLMLDNYTTYVQREIDLIEGMMGRMTENKEKYQTEKEQIEAELKRRQ